MSSFVFSGVIYLYIMYYNHQKCKDCLLNGSLHNVIYWNSENFSIFISTYSHVLNVICHKYNYYLITNTRGVLEKAQKVIEGGVVTCRHMQDILRWLEFKLAQNLDHVSKLRDGSLFQFWNPEKAQKSFEQKLNSRYLLLRILSHLSVSKLKKCALSEFWHVIKILSQFEFEPSQNILHMPTRDNTSFDDFLSHLNLRFSRTPASEFIYENMSIKMLNDNN